MIATGGNGNAIGILNHFRDDTTGDKDKEHHGKCDMRKEGKDKHDVAIME